MTLIALDDFTPRKSNQPGAETWSPITVPFGRFTRRSALAPRHRFTVSIAPDAGRPGCLAEAAQAPAPMPPGALRAEDQMAGVASFLIDAAHGLVPTVTLARMIGRFFMATEGHGAFRSATVSLSGSDGAWAMARVHGHRIEVEKTAFGAAHILHQDGTLGLYILEIAPGREIPPHAHEVMQEHELILDDGLLQQERPVAPGLAFSWPLGYVHAYRNPTERPLRVLCIDSPRFMPEDEVPLTDAPPLAPLAPIGNYYA